MSGIGSAIGSGLSLFTGNSASHAASGASQQSALFQLAALQQQQQAQAQVQQQASPFLQYGQNALSALSPLIGTAPGTNPLTAAYTKAFNPNLDQLAQTPGYQFTLQQGLQATQNASAAKGLGSSGNALRGAANYASGLASQTYQQQFQDYWANNQNAFNMLNSAGNTGLGALGISAQSSGQFANLLGNTLTGVGNTLGQGTIASTAASNNGLLGAYGLSGLSNPYSTTSSYLGNAANSIGNGLAGFFG